MRYRTLGKSGLSVSEIGFGAWGIGGVTPGATSYGHTDDEVSLAALSRAREQGINFFDTSNVYGGGHSEKLIGKAFADCRDDVIIATKVGFVDFKQPPDYRESTVMRSVEGSLERLQTSRIDLLQLHNATAEILCALPSTLALLDRLKSEGTVTAIGISVKSPEDTVPLLNLFPFETIQANFNMMDIRALQCGLLNLLYERQVAFIARTPLAFGFLTGCFNGNEHFPDQDHRSRWPREQLRLWAQGAKDLYGCCVESETETPASVALRYCLSYPAVATVIPGILTSEEVDLNVAAAAGGSLQPSSCLAVEALHRCHSFIFVR